MNQDNDQGMDDSWDSTMKKLDIAIERIEEKNAEIEKLRGELEGYRVQSKLIDAIDTGNLMLGNIRTKSTLKLCVVALENVEFNISCMSCEREPCSHCREKTRLLRAAITAAKKLLDPNHIEDKLGMVEKKGKV